MEGDGGCEPAIKNRPHYLPHHLHEANDTVVIFTLCYVIHNNACILFIVFLFLSENFGSESTQSLRISAFFVFFISEQVFVFALARKWNIYCTSVDSHYAYIRILHSYPYSKSDGGV